MKKVELEKLIPKASSKIMDSDIPYYDKPKYKEEMRRDRLGFSKKERLRTFDEYNPELQPTVDGKKDAEKSCRKISA